MNMIFKICVYSVLALCCASYQLQAVRYASFIPALFGESTIRRTIKLSSLNQSAPSNGAMYTITSSGLYHVADDLLVAPINAEVSVIAIAASNVVIFFDNHVMSQSASSTNRITGISLAPGVANVALISGIVSDIKGTGIAIPASTINITLDNMLVDKCTLLGINITGAKNVTLENTTVTRCDGSDETAVDGAVGIKIIDSTHVVCNQVTSNAHVSTISPSIGILINHSKECWFNDTISSDNQGTAAYGFALTSTSTSCHFNRCTAANNTSSVDVCAGFFCSYSHANEFNNCMAPCQIAASNNCYGFLFDHATTTLARGCVTRSNKAEGNDDHCYGFCSQNGTANTFEECSAIGNQASHCAVGIGLLFNERNTVIRSCTSTANTAGEHAYGILLGAENAIDLPERCTIDGNTISGNTGSVKQYGIRDFRLPSSCYYTQNIAYGHGSIKPSSKNLSDTNKMNYMINLSDAGQSNRIFKEGSSEEIGKLQRQVDLANISIY